MVPPLSLSGDLQANKIAKWRDGGNTLLKAPQHYNIATVIPKYRNKGEKNLQRLLRQAGEIKHFCLPICAALIRSQLIGGEAIVDAAQKGWHSLPAKQRTFLELFVTVHLSPPAPKWLCELLQVQLLESSGQPFPSGSSVKVHCL